MSVCLPFPEDGLERAGKRAAFNIVGCLLFAGLYLPSPIIYPYIGMIGGIGVGYSAGYAWQTAFNTFGALSIASGLFGDAVCSGTRSEQMYSVQCIRWYAVKVWGFAFTAISAYTGSTETE